MLKLSLITILGSLVASANAFAYPAINCEISINKGEWNTCGSLALKSDGNNRKEDMEGRGTGICQDITVFFFNIDRENNPGDNFEIVMLRENEDKSTNESTWLRFGDKVPAKFSVQTRLGNEVYDLSCTGREIQE